MPVMTGGEAVVRSLIDHGIDTVFGLPGVQNDWLYNALYDERKRIRVIHTRHEQGAAYMALGYSLARGDIALANVVPGPGVLNAGAALATAYALNAPLFMLTGQVPSHVLGRELGVLHEIPDQEGLLRSLTKRWDRIHRPSEAPAKVAAAVATLRSGRPRPVALEVPMDVLAECAEVDTAVVDYPVYQPPLDEEILEKAARVLGGARSAMIFVGNGAQGVSDHVRALAETLQAPVVGYRTGRGILDSHHYLSLTLPEARPMWEAVDVAIALGSTARLPLQKWGSAAEKTWVRIDVDPTSHARIRRPEVAVTARLEAALPELLNRLEAHNSARASREEELKRVRAAWREKSAALEPQRSYLTAIRSALGEEGVFVDELTQVGFASRIIMPVHRPRTFLSTGYMGTLGYGFPTALGAKVALPNTPVVSVTGDGGFLFAASELATAIQHKIALVTVLFNNNQYGNVQTAQRDDYGGRVIASDLVNPDFEAFVRSFGARYFKADDADRLESALRQAIETGEPAVIEVPVGVMPSVDQFRP